MQALATILVALLSGCMSGPQGAPECASDTVCFAVRSASASGDDCPAVREGASLKGGLDCVVQATLTVENRSGKAILIPNDFYLIGGYKGIDYHFSNHRNEDIPAYGKEDIDISFGRRAGADVVLTVMGYEPGRSRNEEYQGVPIQELLVPGV